MQGLIPSWADIEARRMGVSMSRAELARRAGISESTVFKGLQKQGRPHRLLWKQIDLVLSLEEQLQKGDAA